MKIELLSPEHDVKSFRCGKPKLDNYLKKIASVSTQKGFGRTYVAVNEGDNRVWGYYTISTNSIPLEIFPGLEGAPGKIPVVLLGRFAVDKKVQRQRLGTKLLVHAFKRCLATAEQTAVYALEVEVKDDDEGAEKFYRDHDFVPLLDSRYHLFLTLDTIREAFEADDSA